MSTLISGDAKLVVRIDTAEAQRQIDALDARMQRSERGAQRRSERRRSDSESASPGGGERRERAGGSSSPGRTGLRRTLGAAAFATSVARNPAGAAAAGVGGAVRSGLAFAGPVGLAALGAISMVEFIEILLPPLLSALAKVNPILFGKAEARAGEVADQIASAKAAISGAVTAAGQTQQIAGATLRIRGSITPEDIANEFELRYRAARTGSEFESVRSRQIRQEIGAALGVSLARVTQGFMTR